MVLRASDIFSPGGVLLGILQSYNASRRAARRAALLAPPARLPRIYRAPPARPTHPWVVLGAAVEIRWPHGVERGEVLAVTQTADDPADALVRVRWPDGNTTRHVAAHMEPLVVSAAPCEAVWRLHLPSEEFARPCPRPLDLTRPGVRRRVAREVDRFLIAHDLRLDRLRCTEGRLQFTLRRTEEAVGEWVIEMPCDAACAPNGPLPSDLADVLAWMVARRVRGEPAQNACADVPRVDAGHPDRVGTRCGLGLRRYLQIQYGLARRPRSALPCRSDRARAVCAGAPWPVRCRTLDTSISPAAAAVVRGIAGLLFDGPLRR